MIISRFASPPEACRPLQFTPPFEQWCGTDEKITRENLQYLRDLGMSGLVVSVSLSDYLRSESAWAVLRRGVRLAADMGLRVWIYDEKGYPSGAAGGGVLEELPEGEAMGLVQSRGPGGQRTYSTVRLFEGTHATENFYQKRPYINILDPDAVDTFVRLTHDQYARVLDPIGECVEAFFTDEPSLIAAYIPRGKEYPLTIPWHPRLPALFRSRKGYDLDPYLQCLFEDTGDVDRKIRCDFYEVIADLCAENYCGRIQQWCRAHGVLSSGHLLGEETLVWQTLFEGDPFPSYRRMDIPGIDMILSDPAEILKGEYFLVPKLGSAGARLQGKRRLMCEISDFLGAMHGSHASLAQMQCTAGLLSALGVTDFVSMYQPPVVPPLGVVNESWTGPAPLSAQEFRAYADFAARVNAVFSAGRCGARTAVLHPLRSIWARFTPSGRSMYEPHPSAHVVELDRSFTALCRDLLLHQMDFDIVDERSVSEARLDESALVMNGHRYVAIVLPPLDTVRTDTMETLARFADRGGAVLFHALAPEFAAEGPREDRRVQSLTRKIRDRMRARGVPVRGDVLELLRFLVPPHCDLAPSPGWILSATIVGNRWAAYFVVNTSSEEYLGRCTVQSTGGATILDPETGECRHVQSESAGVAGSSLDLHLKPYQVVFLLFEQQAEDEPPVDHDFQRGVPK